MSQLSIIEAGPSGSTNTRFTDSQRVWVLTQLSLARGLLNKPESELGNTISDALYDKFCVLFDRMQHKHGLIGTPSRRTVKSIWQQFFTFGKFESTRGGGRPAKKVGEEIEFVFNESDKRPSTRNIRDTLGAGFVSHELVRKHLRNRLGLFPYKQPVGQVLTQDHIARRLRFANKMHNYIFSTKTIDPLDICFSDECMVDLNAGANRQTIRFWDIKGDFNVHDNLREHVQFGVKTLVLLLVHGRVGLIGPYLVREIDDTDGIGRRTSTSARFKECLRNQALPELRRRLFEKGLAWESCWYQQDGAGPHTTRTVVDYLKTVFNDRLISLNLSFEWPPKSPDLNLLDYKIWSLMKMKVAENQPHDIETLELSISKACADISIEAVRKGANEFSERILALKESGGRHFEQTLLKFQTAKRQISRDICCWCETIHECNCFDCQNACLEMNLQRFNLQDVD